MRYREFRAARYFPELDGLRAVSILLVITIHSTDPLWAPLHGNVGVTVFFVISGFIITTLLLREEEARGRVRLGAFYARRAFRILPVYYVVLLAYVLLIGVLKLQSGAADLWQGLPWFITYQNDFAHSNSGFDVTWSLAVEEKFYLLWPLVFLPAVPRARRWWIAAAAAVLVAPFAFAPGYWDYPAIYEPIILGCLLALAMNSRTGYSRLRPLATTPAALVLIALLVADMLRENGGNVHVLFAVLAALLVPAALTGPEWLRRALRSRLMVYIGTRSYGLYLVHRLGKGVVDRVVAPGGHSVPLELVRFVLITALGLAGAEVLRRLVEQPMIRLGRRVTGRSGPLPAPDPAVDRPEHPVEAAAHMAAGPAPAQAPEPGPVPPDTTERRAPARGRHAALPPP